MLVSFSWIQTFIKQGKKLNPHTVAKLLTEKTVEVEGVEEQGAGLDHIVVGRITEVTPHPQADRLKVCQVDVGSGVVPIVCGGSNVSRDMNVIVANIGAKVRWHGEGDLIELAPTTIRGVVSEGMICAADEVGLRDMFPKKEEKEIVDLGHVKVKPGTPIRDALHLHDVVFDVDNKSFSNRPDLFGHYGLAREIAALTSLDLLPFEPKEPKHAKDVRVVTVEIHDQSLATFAQAVRVSGITPGASTPAWMHERLHALGLRSIHPVVDVTNIVMLELGQPLHAYDANQVHGDTLIIRHASEGETLTTLDGKEHKLSTDAVVVADHKQALGLGGVIGGRASEVGEKTTDIIIEAVTFVPEKIRKSAASVGVRTDASTRFEKALDPHITPVALRRALELLHDIYGDAITFGATKKTGTLPKAKGPIAFSWDAVERFLGAAIPQKEGVDILRRLGFHVHVKGKTMDVEIPTWRATKDVSRVEDIIEEIVRVYGYAGIPPVMPSLTATATQRIPEISLHRRTKELLSLGCRLQEAYTYSFIETRTSELFGANANSYLRLHNPIAADRPLLRRSVLESLFGAVVLNGRHGEELRLFELGHVFHKEKPGDHTGVSTSGQLPSQPMLAALVVGRKGDENPFTEATRCLSRVFGRLSYEVSYVRATDKPFLHPGRQAKISCQGVDIGYVGELHPKLQKEHDTPFRLAVAEWNLSALTAIMPNKKVEYVPISAFPEIVRDMAFVVDAGVQNSDIRALIKDCDAHIGSVQLFDVYKGAGLEDGKKSVAYRVTYHPTDHAFSHADIEAIEVVILEKMQKKFDATRR